MFLEILSVLLIRLNICHTCVNQVNDKKRKTVNALPVPAPQSVPFYQCWWCGASWILLPQISSWIPWAHWSPLLGCRRRGWRPMIAGMSGILLEGMTTVTWLVSPPKHPPPQQMTDTIIINDKTFDQQRLLLPVFIVIFNTKLSIPRKSWISLFPVS